MDSTCGYIFAVFKFFNIGLSGSLIFRKYLFFQKALPEVYEILNAWYSRYTQCQKEESLALCQIGLATMASMIMKFFLPSSSDRELKEKTMSLISNLRESLKIRAVDLQMLATEKVKEEKFTSMVSSCLNDYLLK